MVDLESKKETFIFYYKSKKRQRIDIFLSKKLNIPRSKVKSLLDKQLCFVNNNFQIKPSYRLKINDKIVCSLDIENKELISPQKGELSVLYHDRDFIVLDKPPGLTVHPAPSEKQPTLVHFLLYHFPSLKKIGGERPGIVHRLDKDTSGLLVVALNEQSRMYFSELFSARKVDKIYLALVSGKPQKEQGIIELPLGRDLKNRTRMAVRSKGGKPAKSAYQVIWTDGEYSLLKVKIFTGRTHQIRVHLTTIGCPILGDKTYGGEIIVKDYKTKILKKLVKRQMLHASFLNFSLTNKEIKTFQSKLPPDFKQVLYFLLQEPLKVILVGLPGSGKTELAKYLDKDFFSADKIVHTLYKKGKDGYFLLRRMLGDEILNFNEEIDRNKLWKCLNDNSYLRKEVEKIIHPLVFGRWQEYVRARNFLPFVVGDIPLYLESRFAKDENVVFVGVFRPEEERRRALLKRGWSEEKITQIESWQFSQEVKLRQCTFVVDNSGDLKLLQKKAAILKNMLVKLKASKVKNKIFLVEEKIKKIETGF